MKQHLRVDFPDDDALISSLITAARQRIEDITGRALMSQQWTMLLDHFPGHYSHGFLADRLEFATLYGRLPHAHRTIFLPRAPVLTVDSIAYIDTTGAEQTLDPSSYKVDTLSEPARVRPAYNQFWPATQYEMDAVTILFTVGYDVVPQPIIQAMKLLVAFLYENREDGPTKPAPYVVDVLLAPYRISVFGWTQ